MTHADDLSYLVTELLDQVTIRVEFAVRRTTHQRTRIEQRAVTRHDPGLLWQLGSVIARAGHAWAVIDIVETIGTRERRTGHRVQRVPSFSFVIPGATIPSGSPGWDADGALSPMRGGGSFESEAPVTAALELEDAIASQIAHVHAHLIQATGQTSTRRTIGGRLRELVHLVALLEDADEVDLATWAVGRARSWVSSCRTLLGYDARIIELARWHCPDCSGRLRTRADDESLVWCAGIGIVHGPRHHPDDPMPVTYPGCGNRWGKLQWVDLMIRQPGKMAR
ncbi:hypothetical protein OG320_05110 [Microbispora sp. NBC_01189]|uniref:hypothetical protein n=1 Tax=Microbispora sp. NBC_01189 TaxID=2903583 RepID=UPI002E0E2DBA|nr:hypothetical protein OG320_05110 [Microbispora sp. NBC_01189]